MLNEHIHINIFFGYYQKDKKEDLFHVNRFRSTVFGNYLAPDDILATNLMLPELDVGDWMYCKGK